jgi:endogenous inhibitor of DNA gyrase (YacG/DUF329 family)
VAELCVLCRKQPAVQEWRPFCSERCRLQDLARWVDGQYRVPGELATDPDQIEDPEIKTPKD